MTVYLDHAATTPLRPEARDAWLAAAETVGNASSIHGAGQTARRLLEDARDRLAAALDCQPIEVVFTSGGTESINLALKGLWWARPAGRDAIALPDGEHHATLDAVAWLSEHEDARVVPVPLDGAARILPERFAAALDDRTALATALVASNEAGTVNDAAALAERAAERGVPLHLDAVAAFGHVPVTFRGWRGDARGAAGLVALSVSGHKVGAPVGTGALVVSREASLTALQHGGGQQRALRAGTQDVAGATALAVAAELAGREREAEAARLGALRDELIARVRRDIPEAVLLGDPVDRLPGSVHLHLPGAPGESLLYLLDREGIAVSTGSACQAGVPEPSHVVLAMGRDERAAREVLRITLGRTTTSADVDAIAAALPEAYRRAARR
ncbi:aminotransferase class V-fold PLP-dependent enzyme [Microbacterium sp. MEC084]|uniref:cysteine desulfurase family protein n=1 Tax=Microbacterium sp. MEC084 TaxID=1963027 RepID=UPI00107047DB|nr:cysteine desulfurase family protein [Microbacterium sp. MEC084]MCD1269082.1 aminotransferase class V-fold PLP-dependent enzyme [Microbacterium sp. MEC084]